MKLAISNIAWPTEEEHDVARVLQENGVTAVEVAPTRISVTPLELTADDVARYRAFWADRGIRIVAMQALLFGRPDLQLFGTEESRRETFDYLARMIEIGGMLGAETLVFGSPKNRLAGTRGENEVRSIERDFFGAVGEVAVANEVVFCVEPNPAAYGCDYIRTLAEEQALLARVRAPGLGLHLDTGQMTLEGEPPEVLDALAFDIQHFHVSEPELAPTGSGATAHAEWAAALRRRNYDRWLSIEMRPGENNVERVRRAVAFTRGTYGLG